MQGDEADTGGAAAGTSAPPACAFFKKPSKGKSIRKRTAIEEGDSEDEDSKAESLVLFNKKKKVNSKLHFSSGTQKPPIESEAEKMKSSIFEYESSKEIQVHNDSRATATLETETEFSRDARALRERALKQSEEELKGKSKSGGGDGEKLYKGMHGYTDYKAGFRREQTIASEKAGGSHGPLRASAHIRVSARFDYQPDICKDYKETGYCGYGDSCKFMHDRGDYKPGWQLEKEWDEKEKARLKKMAMGVRDDDDEGGDDASDEDDENALPFACFICRGPFVDPVMTRCKHYFCEHCALKHHARKKKCFVCDQPTNGIFNTAFEIRKRIAAEKK